MLPQLYAWIQWGLLIVSAILRQQFALLETEAKNPINPVSSLQVLPHKKFLLRELYEHHP
jgi:hypothetical protein